MPDRQASQRGTELGQRQPGVEERRQEHVPGSARETVQVHHPGHLQTSESRNEK